MACPGFYAILLRHVFLCQAYLKKHIESVFAEVLPENSDNAKSSTGRLYGYAQILQLVMDAFSHQQQIQPKDDQSDGASVRDKFHRVARVTANVQSPSYHSENSAWN